MNKRVQIKRVSFDIVTRASEPLEIDAAAMDALTTALNNAAREHLDLRYYPDSRYSEEQHEWVGVSPA